ncbi:hypothetical protein EON65_01605 [archaeon]|nr:MAG: hypothetical protein EON65_01605 [archaeon]
MRDTEVMSTILSDAMLNTNHNRGSVEIGNSSSLDVTHNRSTRISRSRAFSKSSMKLRQMSQLLSVHQRSKLRVRMTFSVFLSFKVMLDG